MANKKTKELEELENIEEEKIEKKEKPKKSKYERRKIILKIVGWIMALAMIFGSLISIFGMLIYYN
jgi:preprotein translocase subunit Sec63